MRPERFDQYGKASGQPAGAPAEGRWNLGAIGLELKAARSLWRQAHPRNLEIGVSGFPSQTAIDEAVANLLAGLFPQRLGGAPHQQHEDSYVARLLDHALTILASEVDKELRYWARESAARFDSDQAETIVTHFASALPDVRALVDTDIEAAFLGDPAARSVDEILICYPCALAVIHHRLAHQLFSLGAPLVARIISELANARTGIDIHPGATIGPSFFIDHGTGVVIGETAVIGANVRLYQAVTLGARSLPGTAGLGPRERYARHPVIEDDVIIYGGATLLGRITIGRGSVIGGNVWLTDDVPPDSIVTQVPGHRRVALADERASSAFLSR
jgi:serine O-acetyltransferase